MLILVFQALSLAIMVGVLFLLVRIKREDARIRDDAAKLRARAEDLESRLQGETARAERAEGEIRESRAAETAARENAAGLEARLQAEKDKIQALQGARDEMTREFEGLAQKVLAQKGEEFDKNARKEIGALVNPLEKELREFRSRAEKINTERAGESARLLAQISNLQKDAVRVAEDANNLTRALRGDKKTLGDWGETTLERLLEESGLRRGAEYEMQRGILGEEGESLRPDCVVRLPEGRHLIVDSKASLSAYHAHVSAETEEERERTLAAHVAAVRAHARGLSEKHYQRGRGVNSPDFVLMFMPIEAAWMAALQASGELFDDSYNRKVVIVSRTTLLPTLKTVAQLWKLERQAESVREVSVLAGRMHDKFADLLSELGKVERALDLARQAHGEVVRKLEGRDNLLRQAKRLEEMGASTKKKLPRLTAGEGEEEE